MKYYSSVKEIVNFIKNNNESRSFFNNNIFKENLLLNFVISTKRFSGHLFYSNVVSENLLNAACENSITLDINFNYPSEGEIDQYPILTEKFINLYIKEVGERQIRLNFLNKQQQLSEKFIKDNIDKIPADIIFNQRSINNNLKLTYLLANGIELENLEDFIKNYNIDLKSSLKELSEISNNNFSEETLSAVNYLISNNKINLDLLKIYFNLFSEEALSKVNSDLISDYKLLKSGAYNILEELNALKKELTKTNSINEIRNKFNLNIESKDLY